MLAKIQNSAALTALSRPTQGLIEPYFVMGEAARMLGLKYHIIQRNVRRGIFPAYRVGGRLRVRISEIQQVIETSRQGGGK
jgi:excisionase family DNA binding protein